MLKTVQKQDLHGESDNPHRLVLLRDYIPVLSAGYQAALLHFFHCENCLSHHNFLLYAEVSLHSLQKAAWKHALHVPYPPRYRKESFLFLWSSHLRNIAKSAYFLFLEKRPKVLKPLYHRQFHFLFGDNGLLSAP